MSRKEVSEMTWSVNLRQCHLAQIVTLWTCCQWKLWTMADKFQPLGVSKKFAWHEFTGKNNAFPILDILGYLKNTHKNPKFGRVRQIPIWELGWEFPDWVSLSQIWEFCGYSLNTLKYPKLGIRYFFLWKWIWSAVFSRAQEGWQQFPALFQQLCFDGSILPLFIK